MKKALKLFLPIIIALILSMTAISVFAVDQVNVIESTDFKTHQGENFETTLFVPAGANISSLAFTLNYDTDLISLVSVDDCINNLVYNDEVAGVISINFDASKNLKKQTTLLKLTFRADDNIGVGVYDCITIDEKSEYKAYRLTDFDEVRVDFTYSFAKLVIYEMGDVNLSENVDIADVTRIRRHLAQFEGWIFDDFQLTLADTYTDGVIDIADPICLQRHLAKLDVVYGNRVNITFYNGDGEKYLTKSVYYDGTLTNIPAVPEKQGYVGGVWSQSPDEYIAPNFSNLTKDINLYVYYDSAIQTTEAIEYYKRILTDMYYSGDLPTNLSSDLNLQSTLYYQSGYHASLVWNSDSNYILNSTTGAFTKPTYPQDLSLGIKIISYDGRNVIEGEDRITFDYRVPGMYMTPTKAEVEDFLKFYFTDKKDDSYRVNYDVKLLQKVNNTVLPTEGSMYDNFEIRLNWYQNIDGTLTPVNQIKRKTSSQINDYVAVATFNGKPLEDDGKIYLDNVEVTAIEQMEIKNYIINQIAASQGTLATNDTQLWNNDTVYGTTVTWESGNTKIAYVANNTIQLKQDAVSGSTLPLNARVSYAVDGDVEEFILSYNLTVSCDNTKIKAPENMDPELYRAIKTELEDNLGYRGDLTSAALADVRFVNLDLSDYPEISSLRGLSYCTNLRTLNISGLKILDGTMNQIATLSYLEAFIARGCGLDNLTDGGTATLRNAVNLKMIDLTNNNFTSLNSVFAEGVRYGKLREVYLSNNRLTDINALSRAPMMTYLSLSGNGLTTEGSASVANYPLLTYLSLAENQIDSVEHLKGLKYLRELRLQHNQLTNINDLRRLTNLEILYVGHNKIRDIGFLNALTQLIILYANDNLLTSVSNLTDLTKLEVFNVNNNKITSLAILGPYKSTLTEVYAENNLLTDFSFVNGASKLHMLMLGGNKTTMAQDNMSAWLSGLANMQVLTLSGIRLNDLSFLSSMTELVRLDVADCGLSTFSGEESNIAKIAERYATLKVLDISNNDFNSNEILNLRNVTLLTVLYADNICEALDINTLTYSMTELKFISLENCGITSMGWLSKFNELVYVDLAGNSITDVNLDQFISNSSKKTIEELYLDTNVACSFENAYRVTDFNVERLSLCGVNVRRIENLPYLDSIKYLNISNTGMTNLTGDDAETSDLYSVERFTTLETIDLSGNEICILPLENMDSIKTVFAVGAFDSQLFYKENLHSLQRLYNKGVTCYLYDKETEYTPVAQTEGTNILNLIDDFSCDITVAADNLISDNNPFIIDEINDFDITWSVSNPDNYEIVNNHLAVKSYVGIEDETLTVTAQITVYPDQAPVTRDFTINTHILRISPEYYDITATGYSEQLTRDSTFTYDLAIKAAPTEGFTDSAKPVEDNIDYSYSALTSTGIVTPYVNVISIGEGHTFTTTAAAPLNATLKIKIDVNHVSKNGTKVADMDTIEIPVTIVSRTFTATFVMNGGTIVDANNLSRETIELVEDSNIFDGLTFSKPGYIFKGWYTDADFSDLFSVDGTDAIMPSNNITLYAKWEALSYTVHFNANGGNIDTESMTALSDVELGELPIPERTYYTFDGWFTEAEGGEQVASTSKFARTEDMTLYAHWTLNSFVITFNTNGGSVSTETLRAYCGQELGTLPTPTRDYYTFDGWYTDVTEGEEVTASSEYDTANDMTVYAHWKLNPLSGWVMASDMPSDAQVANRKYSYTYRDKKESGNSTMSGYTLYDTKRTSWGATQGPVYSNPSNGKRNVWSESYVSGYNTKHIYRFYKWGYSSTDYSYSYDAGGGRSYLVVDVEYWPSGTGDRPVSKDGGTYKWWTGSKWSAVWYESERDEPNYNSPIYGTRWYYQEPVYTYYFYKDIVMEQEINPSGTENVSNIVEWVQYRPKVVTTSFTKGSSTTYNGHTYTVYTSSSPITWANAKIFCENNGGNLTVITSEEENNVVKSLAAGNQTWVGLSKTPATNWTWVNGESFSYSNWNSGEPNCDNGKEYYAEISDSTGLWNDLPNDATNCYIFIMEQE